MESKIEASGPVYFIASQVVFFQNKIMLFSYQIENLAQMKLHLHLESQRTECISKHTKMFVLSSCVQRWAWGKAGDKRQAPVLKDKTQKGSELRRGLGIQGQTNRREDTPHSVPTKKSEG